MAQECNDEKCYVHGNVKVRGNVFTGKVVSAKAPKTIKVEREVVHFVKKYERYKKVKSKIAAHNPDCMNAKEGDIVTVGETRKLSKTKNFTIMSIDKRAERPEAKKESMAKKPDKKIKTAAAKGEKQ